MGFSPYKKASQNKNGFSPRGNALLKVNNDGSGTLPRLLLAIAAVPIILLAACHSYHIDATIENRTGADIQLLEVDYPSASFGADRIAAGATFHYRFQVRGSGPLTLSYTSAGGKEVKITGPDLAERQQGQLQ